jgi:hypothetical protein
VRWLRLVVLVACFAGFAGLSLYPLLLDPVNRIPGANIITDYYHFHWNYWWIRHALSSGLNVYETNTVLAPFTSSLALHTLTPFWYPLWALTEPLIGTIAAMTGVFVVALTFNGVAFYAFLRSRSVHTGWALVGGVLFMLAPQIQIAVFWTNLNLLGWFWLPVLMLVWDKIVSREEGKLLQRGREAEEQRNLSTKRGVVFWVVTLGMTVWAMVLTDVQYPLFAAFIVAPYALWTLWQVREPGRIARLIAAGVSAGVIGLALLWLAGPLRGILSYDRSGLTSTPVERAVEIPFPQDFISYSRPYEQVALGALPLVLVAFGVIVRVRHRIDSTAKTQSVQDRKTTDGKWFWFGLALPPLMLAAGGFVTFGETTITLPYVWLHNLFGGQFRYPERFSMVFLIPALTFAFMALSSVRLPRMLAPVVMIVMIALDTRLYLPIPTRPAPLNYTFYHAMASEDEDYVVVEVPTGGSSGEGIVGEREYSALQFYGTVHGKRMVNGHIARVNTVHYWWMRTDDPMMSWLGQRRLLEAETVRQQLSERLIEWPIGYIVIHRNLIWRSGPTQQEIFGFLNQQDDLICPVWVEGDAVVYRGRWHPAGCPDRTPPESAPGTYHLDIGANDDVRSLGWGWHEAESIAGLSLRWMGQYPQTDVYLDLPPGQYRLRMSLQAFDAPRRVNVLVNGQAVGEAFTVSPASLNEYTVVIPAESIGDGRHVQITLTYDTAITPQALSMGDDQRPLAISADWLEFERISS